MIGLTIINFTIILIIDNTIGRITTNLTITDRITIGWTTIDHITINRTIDHAIIVPIIIDLTATNLRNALGGSKDGNEVIVL